MTREEFAKVMAYVTAGSGKSLEPVSLNVYFDLLGDLPYEVLYLGAKRVLLSHRFATFPTIAELREAAVQSQKGEVAALSAAEAWALAWRAAARIDPEIVGSFDRGTAGLPPLVVRAMQVYGVNALCYGAEPMTVVRAQFMKIFEQLAGRERQEALLPAATKQAIEARAKPQLTGPLPRALSVAGWLPPAPDGK